MEALKQLQSSMKELKEKELRKRKGLSEKGRGKKYFKRSELEALQTEGAEEEGEGGSSEVVKSPDGTGTGFSVTGTLLSPSAVEDSPIFSIPKAEVIRRLREREEPIRLFGETDRDVCLRLRQIEILAPEVNKGLRNDFKDALDQLDQEYLDQIARQDGEEGESADLRVKDDGTTIEELTAMAGELVEGDEDKESELCLKTFKFLLREWAKELNGRTITEKRNYQGKNASATFKQTETYLSPLFSQLRKKDTLPDIRIFLSQICLHLLNREYVKASDFYLQMAIGNAPWPIGVTMVGIHARTGREKIFANQIAHVLNDETQRKYIQGVKRLMTFCQRRFETAPSKCVEYGGIKR